LENSLITLGEMTCRDYAKSSRLEWLETNGLGSFASGTVSGANTRRYHGLLVASLHPRAERFVTLSKLEETVLVGKQYFELATNQFPETISPKGHYLIQEFRLNVFPSWIYNLNGLLVEKAVFMLWGENTTVIRYRLLEAQEDRFAVLALRPFVAFRDYHSLASENEVIQRLPLREEPALLRLQPYDGLPALTLHHNAVGFTVRPDWYRQFEYVEELHRGLNFREDLFTHGYFSFELSAKTPLAFVVATLDDKGSVSNQQVEAWETREESRRRTLMTGPPSADSFVQRLQLAADAFVIRWADGSASIIAGYHWFTDWGRDAMMSLPGLALTTHRFALAKDILSSYLKYCDRGMLPNRFPDRGSTPEFNTVDATLWLFHAVHQYFLATSDVAFLRDEAFPKLDEVIDWHVKGTRYGIHMDAADGLLTAGEPGVQLTWMDAKIGGWVVTPRQGKAVEVNALWHHAVCVMEDFSRTLKNEQRRLFYRQLRSRIQLSFDETFWNPTANCLFDCIQDGVPDAKIRPNQIFAVSLPHPLLALDKAQSVVQVVKEKLLTPFGLRSLASGDPDYHAVYQGNGYARDSAYHQGTVWGWLIGPFVDAYLNAFGESGRNVAYLKSLFEGFRHHLSEGMLGSISEIFDGEAPHAPKGCAAQAWSVAEVLRCYRKLEAIDRGKSVLEIE